MTIRLYNDFDARTIQSVAKKAAFETSPRKVEGSRIESESAS